MNHLFRSSLDRMIGREEKKIGMDASGKSTKYHTNRISAMKELAKEYELTQEKKLIYVCSPYAGDVLGNTERARKYAKQVIQAGCVPFVPHLLFTQIFNDTVPAERGMGCALGLEMLDRCDELWYFGNTISPGMKQEIAYAEKFGIPTIWVAEPKYIQVPALEGGVANG